MSDQKNELDQLYKLREKLENLYEVTTHKEKKDKISSSIKDVKNITSEMEAGNWVNPVKLKLLNDNIKEFDILATSTTTNKIKDEDDIDFDVEMVPIISNSKDSEMNTLYSYYKYFQENFMVALSQAYLKLDYNLGKKRDDLFVINDTISHLVEEYREDMNILTTITNKEQSDKYKERLSHQKKYLFIKLSEYLRTFLDFLNGVVVDLGEGRKNVFNANEKFLYKFNNINKKNHLVNLKYKTIIKMAYDYIEIFITVLRLPDFKRK